MKISLMVGIFSEKENVHSFREEWKVSSAFTFTVQAASDAHIGLIDATPNTPGAMPKTHPIAPTTHPIGLSLSRLAVRFVIISDLSVWLHR